MKTCTWLVAVLFCLHAPFWGLGQCGTLQTATHTVTINGLGSSGDDPHTFSFPRFNADAGTLMDVNIDVAVNLTYNYTVENLEGNPKTFRLKVNRFDDIYSPAFNGSIGSNSMFPNSVMAPQNATNYYSHAIQGVDGTVGSGDDFAESTVELYNNYTFGGSVDVVNFIGTGNVPFEYYTTIFTTSINGSGTVFNSAAVDEMTITLTYTYCDNIMMASGNNRVPQRPSATIVKNRLFPNPSSNGNFNLQFHDNHRGDWQVEILNSSGQLIIKKVYQNVSTANVQTDNKLTKGIYIIRATNIKSRENFIERLLVR